MLILDKLAAQREPSFYGVPALGGTRHAHAAIKYRYERRPRVLPVKEVLGRNAACGIAEAVAAPILD
jgi:hypothetical protein